MSLQPNSLNKFNNSIMYRLLKLCEHFLIKKKKKKNHWQSSNTMKIRKKLDPPVIAYILSHNNVQ